METDHSERRPAASSLLGCLIPVFWMLIGNGILAICALVIAANQSSILNSADALYWITVGCLLVARFVDIRYLGGRTSEGNSATMAHWRRYAVILVVMSAVLWILVHLMPDLGL